MINKRTSYGISFDVRRYCELVVSCATGVFLLLCLIWMVFAYLVWVGGLGVCYSYVAGVASFLFFMQLTWQSSCLVRFYSTDFVGLAVQLQSLVWISFLLIVFQDEYVVFVTYELRAREAITLLYFIFSKLIIGTTISERITLV